jgi:hypothetical protein
MPFDGARWQIDILAADKTAQAFASVDRRMRETARQSQLFAQQTSMGANIASAALSKVGSMLAPLAAGFSAAALASKVWNAGMMAGGLGEQAEQIGLTTDQLQAYRLAAAQAGIEAEQMDAAMMRLTRAMGAANDGNDEMIAKFDRLGVKLRDSQGNLRKAGDVMPELARGLLNVNSETERGALMQEMLGRSGMRLTTVLAALAQGNESVVRTAKEHHAVISGEVIAAWDKLDDQLKVTDAQAKTAMATLGAPIATWALEQVNKILTDINANLARLKLEGQTVAGRAAAVDVKHLEEQLAVQKNLLSVNPNNKMAQSSVAALERRIAAARAEVQMQESADAASILAGDTPAWTPPTPAGTKQPPGNTASKAAAKLDDRLKDLQAERAALEKALAAFDVRGLETVSEVDKRLDAQVKLDQKIASLLKDVPPNSPLAQQFIQEATSVSQLNARLDERKRILTEAEQVTAQFGDGSRALARATADLNAMMAAGAIDADTYARALKATKDAADEQARAARGAAGGFDGFMAGVEQYGAEMQKANSAFELGKTTAQEFGSIFSGVNQGLREGKDLWTSLGDSALNALNRIADKLIQMAMQDLFASAFGGGGGGVGILNLFGGGSSGTSSGLFDGIMGAFNFFPTFADGGNYQAGVPRIVGEKGWELDVPRTSGTIYNQRQLASLLDGGRGESRQPVIVHVHANEGFVTATAEGAAVRVVNRATPGIVRTSVKKAGEQAPAVMARHQAQRGGEWRD